MIESTYKRQLETCDGMVNFQIEIEPFNTAYSIYCRFLLNNVLMGEFEGVLLNCVAVKDWEHALKGSSQRKDFINFLQRRPKADLDILSRTRIFVLLHMELKEAFRGKGLGVRILEKLIADPSPNYSWDIAFGWARSYDLKCDKKRLNQTAAKILGHYMEHLPNCVQWTKRSTFFLCAPGEFQAANASDLLKAIDSQG